MRAAVVSLDGQEEADIETRARISSKEEAEKFGHEAAKLLSERGADKILEAINLRNNR